MNHLKLEWQENSESNGNELKHVKYPCRGISKGPFDSEFEWPWKASYDSLCQPRRVPLVKEWEGLKPRFDAESKVVQIMMNSFWLIQARYFERIGWAGFALFRKSFEECKDIQKILTCFLSSSSLEARACRNEMLRIDQSQDRDLQSCTHAPQCEQKFGKYVYTSGINRSSARSKNKSVCYCDLVHFCALMAINGFELISPDGFGQEHFDFVPISDHHAPDRKILWPAIRLPTSGKIVKGKALISNHMTTPIQTISNTRSSNFPQNMDFTWWWYMGLIDAIEDNE